MNRTLALLDRAPPGKGKTVRTFLFVLGATNIFGCSATFNDNAPASAGRTYVVGSYNEQAAAWLCPEHTHAATGCQRIQVTEWLRR
jgi:hypothetical protein